jgi:hypothetical protein
MKGRLINQSNTKLPVYEAIEEFSDSKREDIVVEPDGTGWMCITQAKDILDA